MTDEESELLRYICSQTKFKRSELGACSITFKADGIHLTIYRAGKKIKDVANSKILTGWSIEDAVEVGRVVQKQLSVNAIDKATSIPLADRLTAKKVNDSTQSKDNEDEDW